MVLSWIFGGGAPPLTGRNAAVRFKDDFQAKYGEPPNFVEDGYREAERLAQASSKLLLVYLHCPLHQDTDTYCAQTLASQELKDLLENDFVIWGGDISYAEPYLLMNEHLRPSTFPSIAVLLSRPGHALLVDRIDSAISAGQLTRRLAAALAAHHAALDADRAASFER